MSWLARSIANSLRLDEDDVDAAEEEDEKKTLDGAAVLREDRPRESTLSAEDNRLAGSDDVVSSNHGGDEDIDGDYDQGRGVKEDLSELKDSLTRQFWGVATFLAPPPPPPLPPPAYSRRSESPHMELNSESKSDVAVSGNAVEEDEESVNYDERESDQFGELVDLGQSDEYYRNILGEVIGITEETLAFATNIAHHPETWLDFPLSEEEDFDDFGVSDAQYKHVLAIEHLAPRLAALRYELCPVHMSEDYFWMVYFVLLHSRLNKHDADLLSSPQLVQARAMWMQELQKQTKEESHWLGTSSFHSKDSTDSPFITHTYEDTHLEHSSQATADHEIEKHPLDEIEFIDKSVIKEDSPPQLQDKEIVVGSSVRMEESAVEDEEEDDDEDDWLKDDSDLIGYTSTTIMVNEDDISFSDLEDDLDSTMPIKHTSGRNITTNIP